MNWYFTHSNVTEFEMFTLCTTTSEQFRFKSKQKVKEKKTTTMKHGDKP